MIKLSIKLLVFYFIGFAWPMVVHGAPLSLTFPKNSIVASAVLWTSPGEQYSIVIKGGQPPYRWQCLRGDIIKISGQKDTFLYKVPKRFGQDRICIIDGANTRITHSVKIYRPLKITPSKLFIPVHGKARAEVIGGSGKWEPTGENSEFTISRNDNFIIVEAGSKPVKNGIQMCCDTVTGDCSQMVIEIYNDLKLNLNQGRGNGQE